MHDLAEYEYFAIEKMLPHLKKARKFKENPWDQVRSGDSIHR